MMRTVSFPIEWEKLAGHIVEPVIDPFDAYTIRVSRPEAMRVDYDDMPPSILEVAVRYPHPADEPERLLSYDIGLIAVEPRYGNPKRFVVELSGPGDACADLSRLIDVYISYATSIVADDKIRLLNLFAAQAVRWQWNDIADYLGYRRASN